VGGVSLIAIGFAVLKPKKTANKTHRNTSLSGLPTRSKKKKKTYHRKKKTHYTKHTKKKAVALL
jgi:hypothetical protein